MLKDEKKNVLVVMGMEQEHFIQPINPENSIVLHRYSPFVIHPFDDLMRDIILAVYEENIEEIVVVETKEENNEDIFHKLYKQKGKKIQTLDYLFRNNPNLPEESLREWLAGGKVLPDNQHNADVIRNHPLIPSTIKVTELWIDTELPENQKEIINL